uniref:Ig-like domain-containing protein n=1 Tax=Salarias fasciatus TaxID=181472 RepID=A0A672I3G8_SALFA
SKVTVTRGDNITLYCDCELKTGVYIVWYRNCSHENQPTLIMGLRSNSQIGKWEDNINGYFNRFKLVKNDSSNTYDLLITNITDSEEGLYYCGTENTEVKDEEHITLTYVKRFGNTTRIILGKLIIVKRTICWIIHFGFLICGMMEQLRHVTSAKTLCHCSRKSCLCMQYCFDE